MVSLEIEREALYEAIVSVSQPVDYLTKFVSEKQVQALASLFSQGLQDKSRNNRIAVMKFLIGDAIKDTLGVEFTSFKNMTSPIAHFLIDYMRNGNEDSWELSQRGRELITAAEKTIKATVTA